MRKKLLFVLLILLLVLVILPSYIRAYVVFGDSDAPAYVTGDRIVVNLLAYDLKIPYTDRIISRISDPSVGNYILFRHSNGSNIFKRVVAIPGQSLEMVDNQLLVNNIRLDYQDVDGSIQSDLRKSAELGMRIEKEVWQEFSVYISYTPGEASQDSFAPTLIPSGMYFVLGSNRDNSTDSRHFGFVPRERIIGRVLGKL